MWPEYAKEPGGGTAKTATISAPSCRAQTIANSKAAALFAEPSKPIRIRLIAASVTSGPPLWPLPASLYGDREHAHSTMSRVDGSGKAAELRATEKGAC